MSGWRARTTLGEGMRSFGSGGVASVCLVLAIMLALAIPSFVEGYQVSRLVEDEARWIEAGGNVLITSREDGGIEAVRCESLNSVPGVEAAFGARRLSGGHGTTASPGAGVAVVLATSGVYSFLAVSPGGAIIGTQAQDSLGSGDALTFVAAAEPTLSGQEPPRGVAAGPDDTPLETMPVSGVASLAVLGEEFAYAVVVPQAATGNVERCYVRATPSSTASLRRMLPALLAGEVSDRAVVVADRLVSGGFARDFSREMAERPTVPAPYLGGAVAGMVWLLVCWFRRADDSLYATLGAGMPERALLRGTEWFIALTVGSLGGMALIVVGLAQAGAWTGTAMLFAARGMVCAASVATLVAMVWLVLPRGNTIAALKDR